VGDTRKHRHLVTDELPDVIGRQVERPASTLRRIGVARVRPDIEPMRRGHRHQATHRPPVAGMDAAGDVDRRDEVYQGQLDQFFKRCRGFADVSVQIDVHGGVARPGAEVLRQKEKGTALTRDALLPAARLPSTITAPLP
jgi:hypothetical protein